MVDVSAIRDSNAWEEVLDDNCPVNWCLFGYVDKNKISLKGKGEGGYNELLANLEEDKVLYGGFRMLAVDDRGNTVSRRSKFVFVCWVGPNSPSLTRARVSQHKSTIENALRGTHVAFQFEDPSELSQDAVVAKLRACGGAHQPTSYEF
eukprot:GILI01001482.1.p1 GENE.GILI01001482.1~~GILI01001482.1.p1  ORF type:complete len:149 (+),score=36.96 GILI01001482.1:59-505(+)